MTRDAAEAELDLALGERRILVEEAAELFHHAHQPGAVQPDLVGGGDTAASLQQSLESGALVRRKRVGGKFDKAGRWHVHRSLAAQAPEFAVGQLKPATERNETTAARRCQWIDRRTFIGFGRANRQVVIDFGHCFAMYCYDIAPSPVSSRQLSWGCFPRALTGGAPRVTIV